MSVMWHCKHSVPGPRICDVCMDIQLAVNATRINTRLPP
jgi:hypothetical protein